MGINKKSHHSSAKFHDMKGRTGSIRVKQRRIVSLLLCGVMLFFLCPQSVFAGIGAQTMGDGVATDNLCKHHPEHDDGCGYFAGTTGISCTHEHTDDCYMEMRKCTHEHDEDCYPQDLVLGNNEALSETEEREPENCSHSCDEDSRCVIKNLNCTHEHDSECGYTVGIEGALCGYMCGICNSGESGTDSSDQVKDPETACICEVLCTADKINADCLVCRTEGADISLCKGAVKIAALFGVASKITLGGVQELINALPGADEITEDNAEEVKALLEVIDKAKAELSDEESDQLDMRRYLEALAVLDGLSLPLLMANVTEQFNLTPGETYWFDLSGAGIPGTPNKGNGGSSASLPDITFHWVPFTYTGTINAYALNKNSSGKTGASEAASKATDSNAKYGYTYDHSLFIADYAVTHSLSWDELNTKEMAFGKAYTSGGVTYTLRTMSVGSSCNGSCDQGIPENNEWDIINGAGYIKNWKTIYSWGQDTSATLLAGTDRVVRGNKSARDYGCTYTTMTHSTFGFRPVLEIRNVSTLGFYGLKTVKIDLNGGKIGDTSGTVNIVMKSGEDFKAPGSNGLTRPDGNTGTYFKWLGNDGQFYEPGNPVPANVTGLKAQWSAPAYSVTLDLRPGDLNGTSVDFKSGKEVKSYTSGVGVTLPTADDINYWPGYAFEGWYADSSFSGLPITEIKDTDTGDRIFYAKWEAKTFRVTLDPRGGEIADGKDVKNYTYSVVKTLPTASDMTRKGYTFDSWWYTSSNLGPVSEIGGDCTDITLYAKWTANVYTVTVENDGHGAASASSTSAIMGEEISLTAVPGGGYQFRKWEVVSGGVTINGSKFTMPAENVTVKAIFEKKPGGTDTEGKSAIEAVLTKDPTDTGIINPFTDVRPTDWFYEDVLFVYGNGLMNGTTSTTFSPYSNITRIQIAAIFYRMEGSPAVTGSSPFADMKSVPETEWYYNAVLWAHQKSIVVGYGDNIYHPDDPVTYEQLAVIFRNYANYKGYDLSATSDLMADKGGKLNPQGMVTRAEVAAMLHNFIEKNKRNPVLSGDSGSGMDTRSRAGDAWIRKGAATGHRPQTGDTGHLGFWIVVMLTSLSVVILLIVFRRREDGKE